MGLSFAAIESLLVRHSAVQRLVVAYSGGVDSHVLLHLLATHSAALGKRVLAAIHVDHGLQAASAAWGCHCQQVCQELGVAFSLLQVDAHPQPGESLEAAARQARYQALAEQLTTYDALLTGQHRDDQAETLLLQLLRGAGPHGLAAMPASTVLGRGLLLRPLLDVERAEILEYARSHHLAWVEDASNADRRLDRNYLRHDILPLLKKRWPAATRTLARSARLCAETALLTDALADEDLARVANERPDCLDIALLGTLDETRQRNALRCWFRRLHLPAPNAAHLQHILRDAIAVPHDRQPRIHWPGCEVRRYRQRLFAMPPLSSHDPSRIFPVTLATAELSIPDLGYLKLRTTQGTGVRLTDLSGAALTIRFRQGGERFRPQGRQHAQELKKLLQEAGIPPWERQRLPLLYVDQTLVAVVGLGVAAEFAACPEELGVVLEWQKPSPFVNL